MNKLGAENFKKYANLGPLFGDIRTIFLGDLPTWVTSIIAGPPCKPTSATGSRKGADAADTSTYWAVLHWCCFLFINSPVFRFAIIENVSDILKSFGEYKICLASQIEAYIEHSMKPAIAFLDTKELSVAKTSSTSPFILGTLPPHRRHGKIGCAVSFAKRVAAGGAQ